MCPPRSTTRRGRRPRRRGHPLLGALRREASRPAQRGASQDCRRSSRGRSPARRRLLPAARRAATRGRRRRTEASFRPSATGRSTANRRARRVAVASLKAASARRRATGAAAASAGCGHCWRVDRATDLVSVMGTTGGRPELRRRRTAILQSRYDAVTMAPVGRREVRRSQRCLDRLR